MWIRQAVSSVLSSLTVNDALVSKGTALFEKLTVNVEFISKGTNTLYNLLNVSSKPFVDNGIPGIAWWEEPPGNVTPRTTKLLQCEPAYQNSWTTDVTTGADRLTFAINPCGNVDVHGMIRNSVLASRNTGTIVANLNANAYTKKFIPKLNIHVVLDGRTIAGFTPVIVIEAGTGIIRCYSLDNTTAGAQTWYISASYNVFSVPGKYYKTGGGPY